VSDPEEIVDMDRIVGLPEEEFQELLGRLEDRLEKARSTMYQLQDRAREKRIVEHILTLGTGHFEPLNVQVHSREVLLRAGGRLVFHAELPGGSDTWNVTLYRPSEDWESRLAEIAERERRKRLVSRTVSELLRLRDSFHHLAGGSVE